MSWLKDYMDGRRKQVNPIESALPVPIRNTEDSVGDVGSVGRVGSVGATDKPVIDSNNAIGSLVDLMGPTPAERAERERRAVQNKSAMSAWAGLFDGLRQLGNLYYTSKQASPQVYNNPYEQIDRDVEANRKRMDDLENYRRQYNMQLYGLQRQGEQDRMNAEQHKAQMANYAANNELMKERVESEKENRVNRAAINKARVAKINSQIQQMEDLAPLQRQKLEQTIRKLMHDAGRPYSGSTTSSSDVFRDLAEMLADNPEVAGPMLQQMGYGRYDASTRNFDFEKAPSANAARIVISDSKKKRKDDNTMPVVDNSDMTMPGVDN